jgi:hypothetical protein
MADDTTTPGSTAEDRALDALTRILDAAIAPDMLAAQQTILRRLAMSGDLFPSRIPPPGNITEIGGYLNLIADDPVLSTQVLASALGVAGPNPSPGFDPVLPPMYFASRDNDRTGASAAVTPVSFAIRNDLAPALDAALAAIHDVGATLPVLATSRPLPPSTPTASVPSDLLPYVGRVLELVPSAALVDPATDPLAVGQMGGAGPNRVAARQLDTTAPSAGTLTATSWSLWSCTAATCVQTLVTDALVDLGPLLNAAGWYTTTPVDDPVDAAHPGSWSRWTNVTGLVEGASRFGDELELLYPVGAISASAVRAAIDWVWDGTTFSPGT